MASQRKPLVLIPQHFGCLIFDRRTSRYLPFDHEAATLLRNLVRQPLHAILGRIASGLECEAVEDFFDCFYRLGYFGLDGRLAADLLDVATPSDHLVGPLAVHLEIVAACNLTCSHCFAGTLPRQHHPLNLRDMDTLFADLASLGSFRLGLTGGEPLLRKDLLDVLDAATDQGLHPCLTTNALLLTEEMARELGKRPLVWLNVSLEGPSVESNDAIRGDGVFDAVLEQLKLLRRHARFTLAFTILSSNAHLVRECAELAHRVGAQTAVFRPLYPVGTAREHPELMPTFAQYTTALRELADLSPSSSAGPADLRGLDPFSPETRSASESRIHTSHTCGAGQHVCSISVQGDVNPCSFLGPAFNTGNIRETPFPVIWRTGQQMRRLRQPSPVDGFQGGCRARAQEFNGSVEAADPWLTESLAQGADGGCGLPLPPGANVEVERRRVSLRLVSSC